MPRRSTKSRKCLRHGLQGADNEFVVRQGTNAPYRTSPILPCAGRFPHESHGVLQQPGCRDRQKPNGKGHGPIWILPVSQGRGQAADPGAEELIPEVEKGIRRFAEIQQWLKQVAQINQQLLKNGSGAEPPLHALGARAHFLAFYLS